jgi:hypothetical protein
MAPLYQLAIQSYKTLKNSSIASQLWPNRGLSLEGLQTLLKNAPGNLVASAKAS